MRKQRDIKFVTTEGRRNCLIPETNYHTAKCFSEILLAIEIKNHIFMNKSVYLGLSIAEIS